MNILYLRALNTVLPITTIFFLFFMLSNIGFPPTLNFVSELLILLGLINSSPKLLCFFGLALILSTISGLWIYTRIFFGNFSFSKNNYIKKYSDINVIEFFSLFLLVVLSVLLALFCATINIFSEFNLKLQISNENILSYFWVNDRLHEFVTNPLNLPEDTVLNLPEDTVLFNLPEDTVFLSLPIVYNLVDHDKYPVSSMQAVVVNTDSYILDIPVGDSLKNNPIYASFSQKSWDIDRIYDSKFKFPPELEDLTFLLHTGTYEKFLEFRLKLHRYIVEHNIQYDEASIILLTMALHESADCGVFSILFYYYSDLTARKYDQEIIYVYLKRYFSNLLLNLNCALSHQLSVSNKNKRTPREVVLMFHALISDAHAYEGPNPYPKSKIL